MKSKYYRDVGEFLVPASLVLLFIFIVTGSFTTMLLFGESAFWKRYFFYFLILILFPLGAGIYYFITGWKERQGGRMLAQSAIFTTIMMALLVVKLFLSMTMRGRGNIFTYQPLDFGTELVAGSVGLLLLLLYFIRKLKPWLATLIIILLVLGGGVGGYYWLWA